MILYFPFPDIDECLVRNGGCQESCINMQGSFECRCMKGYMLQSDGKSCSGVLAFTQRPSKVKKGYFDILWNVINKLGKQAYQNNHYLFSYHRIHSGGFLDVE